MKAINRKYFNVSVYCSYCEQRTLLSIAEGFPYSRVDEETYYKIEVSNLDVRALALTSRGHRNYWIGFCNSCYEPHLVEGHGETIWPKTLPSPTDERIQEDVRNDLVEAKLCFSVNAFKACSVMARRAIQQICLDKGATKGKDLWEQINELASNGVITKDLKEWADTVRWIGNDGAHINSISVAFEDAEDILTLAEQFAQILYVTPSIAKEQKKKRGKT